MAKFGYVTLSMTSTTMTSHTAVDISHLRHLTAQLFQSTSESQTSMSAKLELSLDGTNYARVASFPVEASADLLSVQAFLTLSFPGAGSASNQRFAKARLMVTDRTLGAVKCVISGEDVSQP